MELTDQLKESVSIIIKSRLSEKKVKTDDDRRAVVAEVVKHLPTEVAGYFIKLFLPAPPSFPKELPERKGFVPKPKHPDDYDSEMPPHMRIKYKKSFQLKEPELRGQQIRITSNLKRRPKATHVKADLANLRDRSNMPYMGSKKERLGYIRRVLFHWPHAPFAAEELNADFRPPQGYDIKASFHVMTVFEVGTDNPVSYYKVWALYDRTTGETWALWHELPSKPDSDIDCIVIYEHGKPKKLEMLTPF